MMICLQWTMMIIRRGKPTNHKVFGEAMAILGRRCAAYACLSSDSSSCTPRRHRADTALAIVEDLAKLAGAPGMVGGQVADMLGEQGITSIERAGIYSSAQNKRFNRFLRYGRWTDRRGDREAAGAACALWPQYRSCLPNSG